MNNNTNEITQVKGYWIADVTITDPEKYKKYQAILRQDVCIANITIVEGI